VIKFVVAVLFAQCVWAQPPQAIRKAIDKALPPIQRSAATFIEKRACFSCHHNTLPIMALHMAQDRGLAVDAAVLAALEKKTWASGGSLDDVVQARNVSNPAVNDTLLLLAQEYAGVSDATSVVRAQRTASWQREDGHWFTSDFRPPHASSFFTTTATTVRALRAHLRWPADHPKVLAARRWLYQTKPSSTEDASFRLMGLVWAGGSQDEIAGASKDLRLMEKSDGGWGQTAAYPSDGYSTGQAVFALKEAGEDSPKGIKFLVSSQAGDGTWRTRTRMLSPADVSPPYFETGFPYKKDQVLSYAGSCWAVMALMSTLPGKPTPTLPAVSEAPPDVTRLTPFAQLTIAASYGGNVKEVTRLLDAGASPNPPEGTRTRNTPLRLAAMSGDLETVKVLLAHGADPDAAAPVAEAVTFGHADVVQTLIAAGASVDGVESTGINLLHWATITNRASVIPLLAKAGIELDDTDDNGYTPLMYAATLDYGDTKALETLLSRGADPTIADYDKHTPLSQTRRYKHAQHESVLRAAKVVK
jgi:ankyrin repeat protein